MGDSMDQLATRFDSWSNLSASVGLLDSPDEVEAAERATELGVSSPKYDCSWCNSGCSGCGGCGADSVASVETFLPELRNVEARASYECSGCSSCNGCNGCE